MSRNLTHPSHATHPLLVTAEFCHPPQSRILELQVRHAMSKLDVLAITGSIRTELHHALATVKSGGE